MKLFLNGPCGDCGFSNLARVERAFWMRLFPSVRHYYCSQCDSTLLARKDDVDDHQWLTTKPPADAGRREPG